MDTLNLLQILEVFNAPINEEQAWAVCYQCAKYLQKAWSERSVDNGLPCFSCLDAVVLSKDGTVFRVVDSGDNGKRAIPFLPTPTSRPKPYFPLIFGFVAAIGILILVIMPHRYLYSVSRINGRDGYGNA